MKTKLIAIAAILMLAITSSYANFAKDPADLQKIINSQIAFPSSAIEKHIEGAVFVEFTVQKDGSIEVVNCFSTEGELQSYIFTTLSAMKVTPDIDVVGKIYTMRFDFELL